MIFGGDEGVIERARATWGGVYVPRRNLNREPVERILCRPSRGVVVAHGSCFRTDQKAGGEFSREYVR